MIIEIFHTFHDHAVNSVQRLTRWPLDKQVVGLAQTRYHKSSIVETWADRVVPLDEN